MINFFFLIIIKEIIGFIILKNKTSFIALYKKSTISYILKNLQYN